MTDPIFTTALPFRVRKKGVVVPLTLVKKKAYPAWLKKQTARIKALAENNNFNPTGSAALIIFDETGNPEQVFAGVHDDIALYDMAVISCDIKRQLSQDYLDENSFELHHGKLKDIEIQNICLGWALAAYSFDSYKGAPKTFPQLLWPKEADKSRIKSLTQSISMLRNLVNMPANDLGPQELEETARTLAESCAGTLKVTKGAALEKNFPLVHIVGMASPRAPRLLDLSWGKKADPKLTLIGKGVCFDTGGLDIKPSQFMRLMKKDMGGAAHVLALGKLIMEAKLPVNLRILIPAVENSVSGNAFRSGDIFTSRKGLTVENTNTDAEGRLILADALSYACEDEPDLLVDFATLTGSARVALGHEVPAGFSNNDKLAETLKKISGKAEDLIWPMPLLQQYKRHIESPIADLLNSAKIPGDAIYSALFLQQFLSDDNPPDWIHVDCFSWESSGRAGRSQGGCDTGLRAIFALIENRYGR